MSLGIRFTPEAGETYYALIIQLQERWGDKFVSEFEAKVDKSVKIISEAPYIYPIVNEANEIRKCILHKNCSMFYKIFDDRIEIFCFWDNRQDPLFS